MRLNPRLTALVIAIVAACCAPVVTGTLKGPFMRQGHIDLSRGELDELQHEWSQKGCDKGVAADPAIFDDCPSIEAELRDRYFPTSTVFLARWATVNFAVVVLTFLGVFLIVWQAPNLVRAD